MSSFYASKEEVPWKNPDICDIVSPQHNGEQEHFNYETALQTSHEMLPHPEANYMIPGYHPLTVPKLAGPGVVQWLSPSEGVYFDDSVDRRTGNNYHASGVQDITMQNVSRFETDSLSSVSSINGQPPLNNRQNAPISSNTSEKGKSAPKRQRGKVLNEKEAELIEKDDSLLTEDELVIKRKAQNRLAQRAFRERKETKLKELELKLLESEVERQRLLEVLEEIKLQFISVKTENDVLRSNTGHRNNAPNSKFTFPQSQEAFVEEMMSGQNHVINNETVSKIYDEPQRPGQKVLAVGAVWDYLLLKIEEEEYENIDMMDVMSCLKGNEVCHGYGPAYPLSTVDEALKRVAAQQM